MTRRFRKTQETDTDVFEGTSIEFGVDDAPEWLRFGGIKGSTMDNRWFWDDHVMALKVGESTYTDFSKIERIA